MDRKKIKKLVQKWRPKLFLGEWYIDISYAKEDDDSSNLGECLAKINADPVYFTAVITIYPAFFRKSDEVQEHSLVHELCHCVTQEVWDMMSMMHAGGMIHEHLQRQAVERLTQRLANAVYFGVKQ